MSVIRLELTVPDQDKAYELANQIMKDVRAISNEAVTARMITVDTDMKAEMRRTILAAASLYVKEDL
jgi:hypothetical protein